MSGYQRHCRSSIKQATEKQCYFSSINCVKYNFRYLHVTCTAWLVAWLYFLHAWEGNEYFHWLKINWSCLFLHYYFSLPPFLLLLLSVSWSSTILQWYLMTLLSLIIILNFSHGVKHFIFVKILLAETRASINNKADRGYSSINIEFMLEGDRLLIPLPRRKI